MYYVLETLPELVTFRHVSSNHQTKHLFQSSNLPAMNNIIYFQE